MYQHQGQETQRNSIMDPFSLCTKQLGRHIFIFYKSTCIEKVEETHVEPNARRYCRAF